MTLGDIIKEYRKSHNIAPSIQCIKQAADGMKMDFNDLFSLIDGNVSIKENTSVLTAKDERDIARKLEETLNQLDSHDGLMFDGDALDDETKELLRASLENSLRIGKINTKKKYTPKKYRKSEN